MVWLLPELPIRWKSFPQRFPKHRIIPVASLEKHEEQVVNGRFVPGWICVPPLLCRRIKSQLCGRGLAPGPLQQ